jgi:nucleoside-diphosphate-sugar epimerase
MRIFLAGASGLIGVRLIPLLVAADHVVAGMTRTPAKAGRLRELGAEPVVCDVFDAPALTNAVTGFRPDVILHQLTDLPDDATQIGDFGARNNRVRDEGTRNLLAAAAATGGAGGVRVIAQSISWEQADEQARAVTAAHERMVLTAGGVVIRYGAFYGPDTFYPDTPPKRPRIHIDEAARQTLRALDVPGGITMVIDDRTS